MDKAKIINKIYEAYEVAKNQEAIDIWTRNVDLALQSLQANLNGGRDNVQHAQPVLTAYLEADERLARFFSAVADIIEESGSGKEDLTEMASPSEQLLPLEIPESGSIETFTDNSELELPPLPDM